MLASIKTSDFTVEALKAAPVDTLFNVTETRTLSFRYVRTSDGPYLRITYNHHKRRGWKATKDNISYEEAAAALNRHLAGVHIIIREEAGEIFFIKLDS